MVENARGSAPNSNRYIENAYNTPSRGMGYNANSFENEDYYPDDEPLENYMAVQDAEAVAAVNKSYGNGEDFYYTGYLNSYKIWVVTEMRNADFSCENCAENVCISQQS